MNFSVFDLIQNAMDAAMEKKVVGEEGEGEGEEGEEGGEGNGNASLRKRKAEDEPEGSEPAQKPRTIYTVTIGKVRLDRKRGIYEVELSPLKGASFWVPAYKLPLFYSLWDWCYMDIDVNTHQVLDLRAKTQVESSAAKAAVKKAGIITLPGDLSRVTGKIDVVGFGGIVSLMQAPLCLAPLLCSREWMWLCLVFGERIASRVSNATAKAIFKRFLDIDNPDYEMALVLASWGDELFSPIPHRLDFCLPRKDSEQYQGLSEKTKNILVSIEALKKHLLSAGVESPFLVNVKEALNTSELADIGLVDSNSKLVLYQDSMAALEEEEFQEICDKTLTICEDYSAVFFNVTAEKKDEHGLVVTVSGAHLLTDAQLVAIYKKADKVSIAGMRDLCMVSEMPNEFCSTLFRRLCVHFMGVPPVLPQNDLYEWAYPRFMKGFTPPLEKNQKFPDGTIYNTYEVDEQRGDYILEILEITGFLKKISGVKSSQVILVDSPDDYDRLLERVPEAIHPGAHFNHIRWCMQPHASQNTTSTDICLFSQAFTDRVDTVFVVVRPETQVNKIAASLNFAVQKFVRILIRPNSKDFSSSSSSSSSASADLKLS